MSEDNSAKKDEYKAAFLVVREIVWKYAPLGLSKEEDEVPEDEFDREVSRILPLLQKGFSQYELASRIEALLAESFGWEQRDEPSEGCKNMVRDMLQALAEKKLLQFQK